VFEQDKLNLLERGKWYGHPNHKRAETDPRQCKWRAASEPSGDGYTAPLMKLDSSSDGICEFRSNHFNGQMRGNLIVSKYTGGLRRIILTPDGTAVLPQSDPEIPIGGNNGLDVTQAPNGNLIDARFDRNEMYYFKPNEPSSEVLQVKSVFPFRGGVAGGGKIMIFGDNFAAGATVQIGNNDCSNVNVISSTKIECIIPGGYFGNVDVAVTIGEITDTFPNSYKYITGLPA
jgi:hypothetical protein